MLHACKELVISTAHVLAGRNAGPALGRAEGSTYRACSAYFFGL